MDYMCNTWETSMGGALGGVWWRNSRLGQGVLGEREGKNRSNYIESGKENVSRVLKG